MREENKLRLYLLTRNRVRQNNVKDTSEYLDDIKICRVFLELVLWKRTWSI